MRVKVRFVKALSYWATVAALAWIAAGCSPKSGKLPTYMRPELLYLNDQPYSRLYVEVDSVEGVEVPEELLNTLRTFLARHCSKPDGIEIVRDKPIPLSEVKDVPIGPASVLCLDGPDPNSGSQPAYLHLFFYDTKTAFKRALKNPHTPGHCPSAICYNVNYCRSRQDEVADFILKHEAGHVLGLSKNTAHGDGTHCKNNACLMNASPGWWSGFFGLLLGVRIERELCADCRDELERWRSEDVGPKLAFKGPFLIRREDGHSVVSLPFCQILLPRSMEDKLQWWQVLARLKEDIRAADYSENRKEHGYLRWYVWHPHYRDGTRQSMMDCRAFLSRATLDPSPFISHKATALLEELKQEQ